MRFTRFLRTEICTHVFIPVANTSQLHSTSRYLLHTRRKNKKLKADREHAEMEALEQAFAATGDKRLPEAELICTLEPCFLCAGAILHARVRRVVFGARDPKFGAVRSLANLLEDARLNHRCEVVEGVRAEESAALLRSFFQARRG